MINKLWIVILTSHHLFGRTFITNAYKNFKSLHIPKFYITRSFSGINKESDNNQFYLKITSLKNDATSKQRKVNTLIEQLKEKNQKSNDQNSPYLTDKINTLKVTYDNLDILIKELNSTTITNETLYNDYVTKAGHLGVILTSSTRTQKVKHENLPRKPYWTYVSNDNINIRVGRSAVDNDQLSCNVMHRLDNYWWLHASGCAGSHVVICYEGDDIMNKYPDTVKSAALLAASKSKANTTSKVDVHVSRCRDVIKPSNSDAGTVRLVGDVFSITVYLKSAKSVEELKRLESSKKV
jgi:predicted ribosome quality control (RQC) complex YloA/Tae2 family protein